ncbi:hypothetical protein [Legionella nagasakiensis]|uniref:hypothetical protein n=1 Tax=Legionella nagasakiensis TaxID=535290 RepID=UPI0010545916|nr:hypothetical protein [Legionella nagasakiensis]
MPWMQKSLSNLEKSERAYTSMVFTQCKSNLNVTLKNCQTMNALPCFIPSPNGEDFYPNRLAIVVLLSLGILPLAPLKNIFKPPRP